MADIQTEINRLAILLRVETIEFLVKEDRLRYGAAQPSDEELEYYKVAINALPCCTALLRRLFRDAHDMHEDKGMYPHAVSVGDLEWCLRYRAIGYISTQCVKYSWMPLKHDSDLRRLPAFVALAKIYKPMIERGQKVLPPVDKNAVESEALAIINDVADSIRR